MKKILFCIPSLDGGGAERVFVNIMNNLDRKRFSVHLVLLQKKGAFLQDLAPDIEVRDLRTDLAGSFLRLPGIIDSIRPDVVISTICYMNLVLGVSRTMVKKANPLYLGRESDIPSVRRAVDRCFWDMQWLFRFSYARLDKVVCQSTDMRNDVHNSYGIPFDRIVTIYNPTDVAGIRTKAAQGRPTGFHEGKLNVVAIGRLHPFKGFDMLLSAMKKAGDENLHLHLLGEGKLAGDLKRTSLKLGLRDRVTFHGFVSNPYPYMREADAFILSSRSEGFPNALVEALVLGCPAVAFNCLGGINELVEEGRNGRIVPLGNIDALAEALKAVASFDFDRKAIAEDAAQRYNIETIISRYEELFEKGSLE